MCIQLNLNKTISVQLNSGFYFSNATRAEVYIIIIIICEKKSTLR